MAPGDVAAVVGVALFLLGTDSNALLIPPLKPAAAADKLGSARAEEVLLRGPALPFTSFSLSLAIGSRLTNSLCSN
jgi:hypothetical protein